MKMLKVISLLLAVLFFSASLEAQVNGRNVTYVAYSGSDSGTFEQTGDKSWAEYKSGKTNVHATFTETNRDDWSVYLRKSDGANLQLDLHTKKVNINRSFLYNISDAKINPIKPAPNQPYSPNTSLVYNIESKAVPNRYLDVSGSATQAGTNIGLYGLNNSNGGTPNQRFKMVSAGSGIYTLESALKKDAVVDIKDFGTHDGNNIQLHFRTGNGNTAQKFKLIDAGNGYVQIKSVLGNNIFLGVADDNNNVVVRNGDKGDRVLFKLKGMDPNDPALDATAIHFTGKQDRGNGVVIYNFEQVSKDIPLAAVESGKSQTPQVFLALSTNIGTYNSQRYVNISTGGSRVAASKTGNMNWDQQDIRGYYLEYADVLIECLTPGFTLPSYAPHTTQSEGSVSSTSGVDLSMGASLSKEPSLSINQGVNFGMTYSSNLKAFTAQDNSTGNTVKTRYKLSSTNVSETWSNPKGGDAPYSSSQDLIRMDAAGQFSGTPLNYLPDLAKSNMPLATIGTFKAPNNYKGKAVFKVTIKMHLCKVEKTNNFFTVDRKTRTLDYNVVEKYVVDFDQP